MDNNKLINFLNYIGIQNTGIENIINESSNDLTDIVLILSAEKANIPIDDIKLWYSKYNNELPSV